MVNCALIFFAMKLTDVSNIIVELCSKISMDTKQFETEEEKIIKAGKKVFTLKGREAASLKEIAEEAKVNKVLLLYYYSSKQSLYDKVFENTVCKVLTRIISAISPGNNLYSSIDSFTNTVVDLYNEDPTSINFLIQELNHNPASFLKYMKSNKGLSDLLRELLVKLKKQIEKEVDYEIANEIEPLYFVIITMTLFSTQFSLRAVFDHNNPDACFREYMKDKRKKLNSFIYHGITQESYCKRHSILFYFV